MKVTMKQIAEIAGVHRSTVDKVIHGRPGVSDDVRQKVQKIIDELRDLAKKEKIETPEELKAALERLLVGAAE